MRVYIVRHGKAEPVSETGRDFDRRLAERGVRQAAFIADTLGASTSPPTSVVSSDAERAHSTAQPLVERLGCDAQIDRRLRVDEPASRALDVIQAHRNNGTLCIVGHNPQLAEVIGVLTGGVAAHEVRLRTGEAWEIDIDVESPIGSGRLIGVHRLDD
ncbi:MAG: histidine phosphatase family protein [Planctomycetota bacterium]